MFGIGKSENNGNNGNDGNHRGTDDIMDDGGEFDRAWNSGHSYEEGGPERWVVEPGDDRVIDVETVDDVALALVSGRIDVIGHDGSGARLEISNVRGDRVRVLLDHGRLMVRHSRKDRHAIGLSSVFSRNSADTVSADVSLLVPRDIALKVACVHGDTLVSGLTRGAVLDTVSGTVLANGLSGRLRLDTVSGKVEARDHHGVIRSNTVSGDVTISGDCAEIRSDSVSGDLYADLFGFPERIRVNAVSGNAMLRIDPDVHARCRVSTMSGKVRIDGRKFRTGMSRTFEYEDGADSSPVTEITMSAVFGDLHVMHRVDASPDDGETGRSGAGDDDRSDRLASHGRDGDAR